MKMLEECNCKQNYNGPFSSRPLSLDQSQMISMSCHGIEAQPRNILIQSKGFQEGFGTNQPQSLVNLIRLSPVGGLLQVYLKLYLCSLLSVQYVPEFNDDLLPSPSPASYTTQLQGGRLASYSWRFLLTWSVSSNIFVISRNEWYKLYSKFTTWAEMQKERNPIRAMFEGWGVLIPLNPMETGFQCSHNQAYMFVGIVSDKIGKIGRRIQCHMQLSTVKYPKKQLMVYKNIYLFEPLQAGFVFQHTCW